MGERIEESTWGWNLCNSTMVGRAGNRQLFLLVSLAGNMFSGDKKFFLRLYRHDANPGITTHVGGAGSRAAYLGV
jgi:hypothetical protein